jgi:hypothetical protein
MPSRAPTAGRSTGLSYPRGKCTGVLHSARELRQGSRSGKEEKHRAGSRQGRLAHGEEGSGAARRDTPGVPTLPLPGAPTLREAVAPFQRGVANRYFEQIEELEELGARCVALSDKPELIRSYTRYHWWPRVA